MVTASGDDTARIWNARTGVCLVVLRGHTDVVNTAMFSPDGTRVLTASGDRTARIWSVPTGAQLIALRGHQSWVTDGAFDHDGSLVVTASHDHTARIWSSAFAGTLTVLKRLARALVTRPLTSQERATYDLGP